MWSGLFFGGVGSVAAIVLPELIKDRLSLLVRSALVRFDAVAVHEMVHIIPSSLLNDGVARLVGLSRGTARALILIGRGRRA